MEKEYSSEPCPRCKKERASGILGINYRCDECRIKFFEWKLKQKDKEIEELKANMEMIQTGLDNALADIREKIKQLVEERGKVKALQINIEGRDKVINNYADDLKKEREEKEIIENTLDKYREEHHKTVEEKDAIHNDRALIIARTEKDKKEALDHIKAQTVTYQALERDKKALDERLKLSEIANSEYSEQNNTTCRILGQVTGIHDPVKYAKKAMEKVKEMKEMLVQERLTILRSRWHRVGDGVDGTLERKARAQVEEEMNESPSKGPEDISYTKEQLEKTVQILKSKEPEDGE